VMGEEEELLAKHKAGNKNRRTRKRERARFTERSKENNISRN
jgi:hypothetical protein